MKFLYAYLCVT